MMRYKRAKGVDVIHRKSEILLKPEPSGIFELGVDSLSSQKCGEISGFYIVKWPLGKFYLSCNAGFEDMEILLKDYIKRGRKHEADFAKSMNMTRPETAFPDDGHWVERYLQERGLDCSVLTPNIIFEMGYSASIE